MGGSRASCYGLFQVTTAAIVVVLTWNLMRSTSHYAAATDRYVAATDRYVQTAGRQLAESIAARLATIQPYVTLRSVSIYQRGDRYLQGMVLSRHWPMLVRGPRSV